MSEMMKPLAEWCASLVEALGIFIIAATAFYVLLFVAFQLLRKGQAEQIFHQTRLHLGRGILLGLEFLVAADIIHTVAVELTFKTVGVLAAIVLMGPSSVLPSRSS